MFERFERGWDTATESLDVLRADKELLIFPLLSFLASLLVFGSFAGPIWMTGYYKAIAQQPEWWHEPLVWVFSFVFYAVNYFVILFFNSALTGCALIRFRGGDPTVSDGFHIAISRLPQIFAWTLVGATVGMLLKAVESRSKRTGELISSILGIVWAVATFFVVPILVVEGVGPIDAIKRSSRVISEKWGESFVADLGLGLMTFLAMIPCFILIWIGAMQMSSENQLLAVSLIGVALLGIILISLASSAMEVIARTGLYIQSVDDKVLRRFERQVLGEQIG